MHTKTSSVVFYENYANDTFTILTSQEIDIYYKFLEIAAKQFQGHYDVFFTAKFEFI